MSYPVYHIFKAMAFRPFGQVRARNHKDGQVQTSRGIQFGPRTATAGILRDQKVDVVRSKHRQIVGFPKWTARNNGLMIRKRDCVNRRIDEAQKIMVLGRACEQSNVLSADGEKDAFGRQINQVIGKRLNVRKTLPVVLRARRPGCAGERDKVNPGFSGRSDSISAHSSRERVGGVDQVSDFVFPYVSGQTFRATKTATAYRNRLCDRVVDPACITESGRNTCFCHASGQGAGLGRATKNQEVRGNG